MAIGNKEANTNTSTAKSTTDARYSTDINAMMADAKKYAQQDHKQTWAVICVLFPNEDSRPSEADMAKTLLEIKFNAIKASRESRVSFYD